MTGPLSDRIGRKQLIVGGTWTQAAALAVIATTTTDLLWALGAILLGIGTPWCTQRFSQPSATLPTRAGAHPPSASTDSGARLDAIGALLAGILADAFDIETAIWAVAGITGLSGVVVALRMNETRQW